LAGLLALAQFAVVMPGNAISSSMGQAYYGEISKMALERTKGLRSLYIRTFKLLTVISIPLIGMPTLLAPFVFGLIFGEAWVEAGWFCWPLGLMEMVNFTITPVSYLSTYGYNHWQLSWDVMRTASVMGGFYAILYYNLSPFQVSVIYAIIMIIMFCFLYFLNIIAICKFSSKTDV